jgi:glycosyltransferase involved in cell wall biosynthesis
MQEGRQIPDSQDLQVSIAMATYNGERFLVEQLQSLASQTRLPYELVVCDDCSEDDTLRLVREFASQAPFPVHVHPNPQRTFYHVNFWRAASLCSGDLFAFCDQDDVWLPDKLSRCAGEFEANPDVLVVLHNSRVVDEQLNDLGRSHLSISRRFVTSPRRPTPAGQAHGFALMARRELADVFNSLGDVGLRRTSHDIAAFILGDALGKLVFLPDRLVLYRQHTKNFAGIGDQITRRQWGRMSTQRDAGQEAENLRNFANIARSYSELCEELRENPTAHVTPISARMVAARTSMWRKEAERYERRADLYAARPGSLQAVGRLVSHGFRGDYGLRIRHRMGLGSLVRDLLYLMGILDIARRRLKIP